MRALVLAIALVLLLPSASLAQPTPNPLDACQGSLARASRSLGDNTRRTLGRCVAAGLRCLTGNATDQRLCCLTAAPRCAAQAIKIARAEQRFAGRVRVGRCAAVPFATILDQTGLGFASSADTCRCLSVPTEVTDLHTLGVCLAQLVDGQTTRLLALAETPRAADALACVGLPDVIDKLQTSVAVLACGPPTATPDGATTATPSLASTPAPTATPSNGATPRATRTRRPSRTPTNGATPTPTTIAATTTPVSVPTRTASPVVHSTRSPTPRPTLRPTPMPTATAVCGNGIVEGDEECDGNAFDDTSCLEDVCTCDDFCDDAGGRLGCNRDCTADFSHCTGGGCEF
jgi:hypothetical protein